MDFNNFCPCVCTLSSFANPSVCPCSLPTVRQYADICLFSTAQYKCPVAQVEAEWVPVHLPLIPPFISLPHPILYFLSLWIDKHYVLLNSRPFFPPLHFSFPTHRVMSKNVFISSFRYVLSFEKKGVYSICIHHTGLVIYNFHILARGGLEKRRWIKSGSFCDSGPRRPSPAFARIAFVLLPPKSQWVLPNPGNRLSALAALSLWSRFTATHSSVASISVIQSLSPFHYGATSQQILQLCSHYRPCFI